MSRTPPALPFVSVIVPVFNDEHRIGPCLEALENQTYPVDRREILVVDNGSDDGTRAVIDGFGVRVFSETAMRSSYAARNRGIGRARGSVIAFTDSDCRPRSNWLEAAVTSMQAERADLVGGRVQFTYTDRPSGAELFDSITNMQVERNIRDRNVAKTANLVAGSHLFDVVGLFPIVRSGGDVIWTGAATDAGFRLVYADGATVEHPARRLAELIRKQYRVGRGQPEVWRASGRSRRGLARNVARMLAPRNGVRSVRGALENEQGRVSRWLGLRAWCAGWIVGVATAVGNVRGGGSLTVRRSVPEVKVSAHVAQ